MVFFVCLCVCTFVREGRVNTLNELNGSIRCESEATTYNPIAYVKFLLRQRKQQEKPSKNSNDIITAAVIIADSTQAYIFTNSINHRHQTIQHREPK